LQVWAADWMKRGVPNFLDMMGPKPRREKWIESLDKNIPPTPSFFIVKTSDTVIITHILYTLF